MVASEWTHASGEFGIEGAFRIVMVCEDSSAGVRALKLYERLIRRLSNEFHFVHRLLRFEALQSSEVQQAASRDAARADMVILAMDGDSPLPGHVQAWLDVGLVRMRNPARALVVLFAHPADRPGTTALRDHLRAVAIRAGMDFFLHSAESGEMPDTMPSESFSFARGQSFPADCFKIGVPTHWGINE